MERTVVIDGDVSLVNFIDGEISLINVIDGEIDKVFHVDSHSAYGGPYTVIPKAYEDQTLQTENKLMLENVLVTEVPKYEVSNEYGKTIYIADNLGG